MNEWITVKDKLPELEEYVLGYCKRLGLSNYYIDCVRRNSNIKTDWWSDRFDEAINVTHWMPLPNKPLTDG